MDDHKGGGAVTLIADDPTVRCMERTGYPPWMVYGGKNDEEEQETEHRKRRGIRAEHRGGRQPRLRSVAALGA